MKKQLLKFLVSGFAAVGTDLLAYYTLLTALGHSPAKSVSFISGTCVAYVLNKYWTFEQHRHSYAEMARFGALYSVTLAANVGANKIVLLMFPSRVFFAFLCATGTSTVLNFIGQKWWVFSGNRRAA